MIHNMIKLQKEQLLTRSEILPILEISSGLDEVSNKDKVSARLDFVRFVDKYGKRNNDSF